MAPADGGWSRRPPGAQPAPTRSSPSRSPTPASASRRQAEDHLRGLPAGRRQHQPQVRRHRPWPGHQPRDRQPAGRRDPPVPSTPGERQHLHALPAVDATAAPQAAVGCPNPSTESARHRRARCRSSPRALRRTLRRPTRPGPRPGRRPRRHPARRPGAADRRGRPHASPRAVGHGREHKGFKGMVTAERRGGLALAQEAASPSHHPRHHLPDIDGWTVLDRLKNDPKTRHIPVHIISVDEDGRRLAPGRRSTTWSSRSPARPWRLRSARSKTCIERPCRRPGGRGRRGGAERRPSNLLGNGDMQVTAVATGRRPWRAPVEPLRLHRARPGLPDMTGFDILDAIAERPRRVPDPGDRLHRQRADRGGGGATRRSRRGHRRQGRPFAGAAARRDGPVPAPRGSPSCPSRSARCSRQLHETDPRSPARKVLVVDDDVRNIFAPTSVLERHQMKVLSAENGQQALDVLQSTPDVDSC